MPSFVTSLPGHVNWELGRRGECGEGGKRTLPEDGGDFYEAACREHVVCVVLDEVAVDHVAVWEDWVAACSTWNGHSTVVLGDDFDV